MANQRSDAERIIEELEKRGYEDLVLRARAALPKEEPADETWKTEGVTVAQLIDILKKCDPTKRVELEGCDCYGNCYGADPSGAKVLLRRDVYGNPVDLITPDKK